MQHSSLPHSRTNSHPHTQALTQRTRTRTLSLTVLHTSASSSAAISVPSPTCGPGHISASSSSTASTRPPLRSPLLSTVDSRHTAHTTHALQPCAEVQNSAKPANSRQFFHLFCQSERRSTSRPATCNLQPAKYGNTDGIPKYSFLFGRRAKQLQLPGDKLHSHSRRPSKIPETARSVALVPTRQDPHQGPRIHGGCLLLSHPHPHPAGSAASK